MGTTDAVGGYPDVFLSEERQAVLSGLVEAFILRDASDLHNIRNPQAFRRLLMLIASQTGDLTNFSNWAETLGISVNTVIQYLNVLEESHIIRLIPPYVGGKRAEITSRPKISRSLRSFIQAYAPQMVFVVNTGLQTEITVSGTPVRFILGSELQGQLSTV